ncbi:MAG: hypothetical protein LBQ79_09255 [Deltaproteobacteria bacterium]|jgi:hypothetical protein|nr:hypothetical protein [Deltaproteobacteria bacterium]
MREPRASPNYDRILRLVALFALCGLIYYFSFDNGRQTSKGRISRLQEQNSRLKAENESLTLQLNLLRREAASSVSGGGGPGAGTGEGSRPPASGGRALRGGAPSPDSAPDSAPDRPSGASGRAPGPFIGEAGASAAAEDEGAGSGGDPVLTRLNVRSDESRLFMGGQVLLSVDGVDSLDRTAVVRIQELDTDRREAVTMQPGDSLTIARGGAEHRLLLDQLKGSQAVFILISP